MRVQVILTCLLAAGLAGCAGADVPTEEEILDEAVSKGTASEVPVWSIGNYWTYKMTAGDFEIGTSSLVVTADGGSDYLVGTNDPQIAYFDALFDITFMGEVRKSDLAGSQNGDRVSMFDWPLIEEKAWTTTWDGETLDMYANPMGGPGEFHVMGHRQSDQAMTVEYHYNPAVKWFEYIRFFNADNGTVAFEMELTDNGEQFTGTVYEYTILDAETFEVGPTATAQAETSWPEATELGLRIDATCNGDSAGQVLVGMDVREEGPVHLPPMPGIKPSEYGAVLDCSKGQEATVFQLAPNTGETWAIDMASFSQTGAATLTVEPRILLETTF